MLVTAAQMYNWRYEIPASERMSPLFIDIFLLSLRNLGCLGKEQEIDILAPGKQHFQCTGIRPEMLCSLIWPLGCHESVGGNFSRHQGKSQSSSRLDPIGFTIICGCK